MWMRLKPALLQAFAKESEKRESKLFVPDLNTLSRTWRVFVNTADRSYTVLNILWNIRKISSRKNKRDFTAFRRKDFADVLVTALFAYSIERVVDAINRLIFDNIFNTRDERFVTLAVVDNSIAFTAIYQLFDKSLSSSGNGNDRVDVRKLGELNGIGSLFRISTKELCRRSSRYLPPRLMHHKRSVE
jgi:hypothetical protein